MRSLLIVCISLALSGIAFSGGDDGRAIVNKAIEAAGGEARLAKFQSATWTDKGTFYGMGDGIAYTGKYAAQRPDKFRMEIEGVFTIVMNGDKGWVVAGGNTNEMPKDQIAAEQTNHKAGWIMSLLPLKDKAFTLKAASPGKGGKQATRAVEVSREGYPTVKLYFDAKTNLLIKSEFRNKAADLEFKEVTIEYTFSDFRDIDGAKLAHKIELKRDGKIYVEAEHSELKAAPKLDAKLFERPSD